jgi:hypothetical protein
VVALAAVAAVALASAAVAASAAGTTKQTTYLFLIPIGGYCVIDSYSIHVHNLSFQESHLR